ncbi:MAG: PKD domain-containing protein [Cyclobacteriaceae bacterium]
MSRVVHGLPDDLNVSDRKGWLHNGNATAVQNLSLQANDDLADCSDEWADFNSLQNLVGALMNDTEPDMFYINAPGLSAQFVFGPDGTPRLLQPQNITIQFTTGSFVVNGGNGLIYTFDVLATADRTSGGSIGILNTDMRYYYNKTITYTTVWHLRNITSQLTGTVANFFYNNLPVSNGRHYLDSDSLGYINDTFRSLRLNSVSLKTYTASFEWQNDLLSKVTMTESATNDQNSVDLVYSSFSGGNISRSQLQKIFYSGTSVPAAVYEFSYHSLPTQVWERNWSMDFFGYYNGVANNGNNPKLYFYANEPDSRRVRVTPITGQTATLFLDGSDRGVNGTHNVSGALKKIVLPSGGYVEMEYEPNRYWDVATNEELLGGGVRVKKITSHGGDVAFGRPMTTANSYRAIVKEYEYKLANNQTSGVLLAPIALGFLTHTGLHKSIHQLGEDAEILYSRVIEKVPGQGRTEYEFDIPGVFPQTSNGLWTATKSRIARKQPATGQPCQLVGQWRNGHYIFPFAPSTNYSFKRGFLTRQSQYSENNTLIRETLFTPVELTRNPLAIKALRYEKIGTDYYYYGVYEILTGRTQTVASQVTRESSLESPTQWLQTTTNYSFNSNLLPLVTTVVLPDGTQTENKTKYASDFNVTSPAATDTMAVALKKLNELNLGAQPVEQISKVTLPGVALPSIAANLTIYRDFGNNRVLPYQVRALPPGAAFTEAFLTGQAFTAAPAYRTLKIFREYDSECRLLTEQDNKRNTVGYHYATGPSFPVATLAFSRAQQAVYEGFELPTSFGMTATGTGITYPPGWTGDKAIQFTNATAKIASSSTALIQKASDTYRFSVWAFSTTAKTITVTIKQGATTVNTPVAIAAATKWVYYETLLNLSTITGPFTLEVATNATAIEPVQLDDVVLIHRDARISFQQSKPLTGATFATDDRGHSTRQEYDNAKRVTRTYDRNRNLVAQTDYLNRVDLPPCILKANFNRSMADVLVSSPVTFTAPTTCGTSLSYVWEVDGQVQTSATGSSFIHTFNMLGEHRVKLTLTDGTTGESVSMTDSFCVGANLVLNAYDNNGQLANNMIFDCNSTNLPVELRLEGLGAAGSQTYVAWFKIVFNSGLQIYESVALTNHLGQPIAGNGLTIISVPLAASTNYMARILNTPNSICIGDLKSYREVAFTNNGNCQ